MYVIPVKAGDRGRLSEKEIESQLLFILSDAPCVTVKPPPIGLLTGKIWTCLLHHIAGDIWYLRTWFDGILSSCSQNYQE